MKIKLLAVLVAVAFTTTMAHSAPYPTIGQDVGVCDVNAPSHCLKPDGNGAIPVTGIIGPGAATPTAATASVVTTGGTAVTVIAGPINGGFVTNPTNAARQAIVAAEPLYINMVATPGSTDATANGTTVALDPGQTFTLPALAVGSTVKVNAATSLHKFSVEVW